MVNHIGLHAAFFYAQRNNVAEICLRQQHVTLCRRSGDQIQIVFTFQTLLDDLHVQQAKEAAAETKAQRAGAFRLIEQ
ncbi:Uncharacterised protein [Shigella flexneri]|nr:Uncharacterised protein [Shigella flexneri]